MLASKFRNKKRKSSAAARLVRASKKQKTAAAAGRAAARSFLNSREGGLIGLDLKYKSNSLAVQAQTTADVWELLQPGGQSTKTWSGVTQDDSQQGRDGLNYTIMSMQAQCRITLPVFESSSTPQQDIAYRMIWFLDKQANGAVSPVLTSVIETQDTDLTLRIQGFRDLEHTPRYTVLHDTGVRHLRPRNMNEGAANLFAHGETSATWKFFKKMRVPVKCTLTTELIAGITDNAIHCMVCTDTVQGAPVWSINARLRFKG